MSAYVKYIESSGARVVPIIYGESKEIVMDKVSKLNGILFPGGAGDYIEIGKMIFEEVKRRNDAGQFYPLWGTCLGFERLAIYSADQPDKALENIVAEHVSLPIKFTKDPLTTRMYEGLGPMAWEFERKNMTYNAHMFGVSPAKMQSDKGLNSFWDITSLSYTEDGSPFIASFEAKHYPIFGTQYHPEKPSSLWLDGYNINHSWESIQL